MKRTAGSVRSFNNKSYHVCFAGTSLPEDFRPTGRIEFCRKKEKKHLMKYALLRAPHANAHYDAELERLTAAEFACIADGILYMETHINQDKSLAEIAQMCHVSTSCFRKLFKKYAGNDARKG